MVQKVTAKRAKETTAAGRVVVFIVSFLLVGLVFSLLFLPRIAADGAEKSFESAFPDAKATLTSSDGWTGLLLGGADDLELRLDFKGGDLKTLQAAWQKREGIWQTVKAGEASLAVNAPDRCTLTWDEAAFTAFLTQRQGYLTSPQVDMSDPQYIKISGQIAVYGGSGQIVMTAVPLWQQGQLVLDVQDITAADGLTFNDNIKNKLSDGMRFTPSYPPLDWSWLEGVLTYQQGVLTVAFAAD